MNEVRENISISQIVAGLILVLVIGPAVGSIASRYGGISQDATTALIVLVISLGFHVIDAISNGPYTFFLHITQTVRAIVLAEIMFVAVKAFHWIF